MFAGMRTTTGGDMDLHQTSLLDALIDGEHERCHFCNKKFPLDENNQLVRVKVKGNFYCNEAHASLQCVQREF